MNEIVNDVKTNAQTTASEVAKNIKTNLTKENGLKLWNKIRTNIKNINVKELAGKVQGNAKNIINELQSGTSSYAQVVQKYGFENVAQVLEYIAGNAFAENTV